jgi:hypothetical protein
MARRWLSYGYVYPFIELGLGSAYFADVQPVVTNAVTPAVMRLPSDRLKSRAGPMG